MNTEYKLNLSFKDCLAILLRRNKRCPNCNSKLVRKTEKTDVGEGWGVERQGHNIDIGFKQRYIINVKYICETCENSFLPREFW